MRARVIRGLGLVFLLTLMGGCRSGYYLQAGLGQAAVLWGRVPIEDVLERPDLDDEWRRKLELVSDIMGFAQQRIGLAQNDNYTRFYEVEGRAIAYTLVACPADSLDPYTWTFPIVGRLPYIGFFDRAAAEAEQARLAAAGYDTSIYPAAAYSTLGWFSDPVLSTMLRYDDADFVDVLLHEQTHATVYIEDDIAFNETLGVFIGQAGSVAFFESRGDEANRKLALDRRHDEIIVTRFTTELVTELTRHYRSTLGRRAKLDGKEQIFEKARQRFKSSILAQLRTTRFHSYVELASNNAVLSTMALYNRDLELLERLHELCGRDVARSMRAIQSIARARSPRRALEWWVSSREGG